MFLVSTLLNSWFLKWKLHIVPLIRELYIYLDFGLCFGVCFGVLEFSEVALRQMAAYHESCTAPRVSVCLKTKYLLMGDILGLCELMN